MQNHLRGVIMKYLYIFIFIIIFSEGAHSQWSTDISENNIVSWYTQSPIITTDMENGIIVVAQTHPVDPIIYAQRISVHGERLWQGQMEGVNMLLKTLLFDLTNGEC